MEIIRIEGATHDLGAPKNWDAAKDGLCESLPVRVEHPADGTVRFLSAWKPDATEIERLRAGAPLTLSIVGMHPPVWIDVAAVPEVAITRARGTTTAISDVLWCMHMVGPDEIHAAPDFWTALEWAGELNSHIAKQAVAERWAEDEDYPIAQAMVVPWPGSAETHAESLRDELAQRAAHEKRRRATPEPSPAQAAVPVPEEVRRAFDELTEDELRRRAKAMVLDYGWKPGDQMSGHTVAGLMTSFGLSILRKPPEDRCAYPACGCDHDATCGNALANPPPSGRAAEGGGLNLPVGGGAVEGRRLQALEAVARAARAMPRETPAPGGAGTLHPFQIEAGVVWDMDRALLKLDAAPATPEPEAGGEQEAQRRADILLALEAAIVLLGRNEPGDSRAVSDEFVAIASAVAGRMNEAGRQILLSIMTGPAPRSILTATTADGEAAGDGLSQAARDVLAERRRQVEVEGWTPEHDDRHRDGEIALASAAYVYGSQYPADLRKAGGRPAWWPWDMRWWKPSNRRRDLVKGLALGLAELERLDRLPPPTPTRPDAGAGAEGGARQGALASTWATTTAAGG